ncbi:MAG TPA: enoyl-CoA hydratase-related protein [Thermoleophilaceae bacterium]|jgi:enoyl-CoA hydratase/carnithine racemase
MHLQVERQGGVAIARMDRPEARNALSPEVMEELAALVESFDLDPEIRCVVIAGNDEYFAAGADIKAMADRSFQDIMEAPTRLFWKRLASVQTPMIAAVSGYALGGGFELALACDMIVAHPKAEFGQPEILLGLIPGGGGTQRLTHTIGKQRAMELVLTGRRITAQEAHSMGLLNAIDEDWLGKAIEIGQVVARRPPIAVRLAKEAVLTAEAADLTHERRLFEIAMATEDRVEGMRAFIEKRRPEFRGR